MWYITSRAEGEGCSDTLLRISQISKKVTRSAAIFGTHVHNLIRIYYGKFRPRSLKVSSPGHSDLTLEKVRMLVIATPTKRSLRSFPKLSPLCRYVRMYAMLRIVRTVEIRDEQHNGSYTSDSELCHRLRIAQSEDGGQRQHKSLS